MFREDMDQADAPFLAAQTPLLPTSTGGSGVQASNLLTSRTLISPTSAFTSRTCTLTTPSSE
eukprot:993742-Pleurochrysis_carterae.AAC.1